MSETRARKSKSNVSEGAAAGDLTAGNRAAPDPASCAWQRAVRLLAAHDRSEQEIRLRLAVGGLSPTLVDATIGRLLELRYLDDERFAQGTAEQAVRRGCGSEYVRAHLAMKGLGEATIEAAIAAAFADEPELARRALLRQYASVPRDARSRAKAGRFLLRRGFPEAVVVAILGEDC